MSRKIRLPITDGFNYAACSASASCIQELYVEVDLDEFQGLFTPSVAPTEVFHCPYCNRGFREVPPPTCPGCGAGLG